jgi:hypothetical protein
MIFIIIIIMIIIITIIIIETAKAVHMANTPKIIGSARVNNLGEILNVLRMVVVDTYLWRSP